LVVGALRSVIEELRAEDVGSLPVEQIADDLIEFELFSGWFEAERARRLAVFENKRGIDIEGHSSVTAFLKHRCRMMSSRAHRAVTLAHRLPELPAVNQAFECGDLSLDQVRVFTSLPDHLSEDLVRDEKTLTEAVEPLSVSDARRVVDYWRWAVDGPEMGAQVEELSDRQYLFASRLLNGMGKIDGLLDPVITDLVFTALAAATPPRVEGDQRSAARRRVDALADIARSFLDSGEAPGSERPHVLVLTDLEALQGRGGGVHETANGQVLTPGQIRQYACDATVSRVVFGPDAEPVDIGRASRVVPAAMRRAVAARDRHCRHPGCDRRQQWCDAHHIWHWADGGPTALWNLQLLCRYHHTLEHRRSRSP
jgi:hypothetical protein